MARPEVQELFQRAMAHDDAAAMREGLERLLGLAGGLSLSPEAEFAARAPDFVMEMPQSRERVRGREAMRAMQEAFPAPPQKIDLRRVVGAGRVWVVEGVLDYGEGPWHAVVVFELDETGLIARETRYYARPSEAPAWRAAWVEPID
jgi:hypothetical protein